MAPCNQMMYISYFNEYFGTSIPETVPINSIDQVMSFDELLTKVRNIGKNMDLSGTDFLAVQCNITGDDGGVFYVEIKDGNVKVEPYEYSDRQCAVTMNMSDFNKLLDGDLNPILAFTLGKLKVDGDIGKALEFSKLLKK